MNIARHDSRTHAPLVTLLVAALGLGAAHGGDTDRARFVGDWEPGNGSEITFACGGSEPTTVNVTYGFAVSPGTGSDLDLHVGCHCTLPLDIVGDQAKLKAATECYLVIDRTRVQATITDAAFDVSAPQATLTIVGDPARALGRPMLFEGIDACSFSIAVIAQRTSATPTDCGPDETAVGVIGYGPNGTIDCSNGPGREPVDIEISSDPEVVCPRATGDQGEGQWVLPQTERYQMTCSKTTTPMELDLVRLQICRVDGRLFRPMTADPSDTDQAYAVLMLGSRCPEGSIDVGWQLDTPDTVDASSCAGAAPEGACGPNKGVGPAGGASTFDLHFCLFRAAASTDDVMPEFPHIGPAYAVFHAFNGEQPPWILFKRWMHSEHGSGNRIHSPDEAKQLFSRIIEETADHGIYFNLARVR